MEFVIALSAEVVLRITGVKGGYDTCAYLLDIVITVYDFGKVDQKVLQA